MNLSYKKFSIELLHPFSIAVNSRTSTPTVQTKIEMGGIIGYGEASLPPYLGETQESVFDFLGGIDISGFDESSSLDSVLDYIMNKGDGNSFAKASLDIALHDLFAKKINKPLYQELGSDPKLMPPTSMTLGMDSEEILEKKVEEAHPFSILKVKLGGENDRAIIHTIRRFSSKPLFIDANQGWTDNSSALEMIYWLADQGAMIIEQPLPKTMKKEQAWLHERSPLPLIADESCQNISDIPDLQGLFSGINIKLMKSGGLREARKMISLARYLKFKVMMGCMNESSCAVMAAASLAPLCDYVDLDGPFLIKNNPFEDPEIREGKIILSNRPGLGLIPKEV
jgi:L-alanine-DL-glutamate epimerase-like enolase superfamily enzyme